MVFKKVESIIGSFAIIPVIFAFGYVLIGVHAIMEGEIAGGILMVVIFGTIGIILCFVLD